VNNLTLSITIQKNWNRKRLRIFTAKRGVRLENVFDGDAQ